MKYSQKNIDFLVVREKSDQRGFVLILAMVMLAILSILGVMVLNTTDTELAITTNSRMNNEAFTASDLAMEYIVTKWARDRAVFDPSTDADLQNLLTDVSLDSSGMVNEMEMYSKSVAEIKVLQKGFSVDLATKGNVTYTSDDFAEGGPSVGAELVLGRSSVKAVYRNRAVSTLETVYADLTSL